MLVFIHQKIERVDGLNHAIEVREVALGWGDLVPTRFASSPHLNTAVLHLTVGIVSDIIQDYTVIRLVRF